MRVIFAEAAILDLERIGEYYLRIEPETAPEKVLNIRKACERLAAFPRSGRFIRGIDLRRAVFGPFLIFYRVRGDVVGIARVLHGLQDWRSILRNSS